MGKMKAWWIILGLVLAGMATAKAAVHHRGFVGAASGTTSVKRTFNGPASHLSVYAWSADVQVLIEPHVANGDTMVVRAGDVMNWDDLDVTGFEIIRPSATAVDVWWW